MPRLSLGYRGYHGHLRPIKVGRGYSITPLPTSYQNTSYQMAQSRTWCFTLNNPEGELPENQSARYIVWQLEKGANGTPHYQGYVELAKPARLAAMKKWLPRAHWELRKGNRDQARVYCMKEDTRAEGDDVGPWERGDFAAGGQGSRRDLAQVADMVHQGATLQEIAQECSVAFIKFHKGIKALQQQLHVIETDVGFEPREWQSALLALLSEKADDRSIHWVYDPVGGAGKSRLVKHLYRNYGAVQLSGRVADMAYQYNSEPVVCFDITRKQAENMDHLYSFAESLKNGMVVSTKYESISKAFDAPHVVFFSNALPPGSDVWTGDRLIFHQVSGEKISLDVTDPLEPVTSCQEQSTECAVPEGPSQIRQLPYSVREEPLSIQTGEQPLPLSAEQRQPTSSQVSPRSPIGAEAPSQDSRRSLTALVLPQSGHGQTRFLVRSRAQPHLLSLAGVSPSS